MKTIDKIRAEIKSLQDIFVKTAEELETEDEATVYSTCAVEFGDELLSFLDTLPDEPVTDCHDLEKAAIDFADYARKALYSKDYAISSIADYDHGCIDGFKAGAEWMKAKMISALKNDGELPIEFIDKFHEIDRTAFQNGQANMRAKMMEGAVEADVNTYEDLANGKSWAEFVVKMPINNLGDKVKIIIVKEDEQ